MVGSYEKAKVGVAKDVSAFRLSNKTILLGPRKTACAESAYDSPYMLLKIRYHFRVKCESNANTAFTSFFGIRYVRREHPGKSEPPRREGKMRPISTVVNPIHGNDSLSRGKSLSYPLALLPTYRCTI